MRTHPNVYDKFIGANSPQFRHEHVFFANLNLDLEAIKNDLSPIMAMIANRIESTYRSPSLISFIGASGFKRDNLSDFLQFDDVCIKLLHIESGLDLFVILSAKAARTLLIRLLATNLIDDYGQLFSNTEKGIFSFIVARLLFDLKCSLLELMPDMKLIGIYHCQDEVLNHAKISGFGIYNFSFSFAADIYPVSIALPPKILRTIRNRPFNEKKLTNRAGHLSRPFIFPLKTLSFDVAVLQNMSFGDLILFDHADQSLEKNQLQGQIRAHWHDFYVSGDLLTRDGKYFFCLKQGFSPKEEDNQMEELAVSGASNSLSSESTDNQNSILGLAKNIRVTVSIELCRLPLTLKELCQIKTGEIIELHRKIEDPLEIVMENKVIGHCQPVQIDGRLGIRVLNITGEEKLNHNADMSL